MKVREVGERDAIKNWCKIQSYQNSFLWIMYVTFDFSFSHSNSATLAFCTLSFRERKYSGGH